MVLDCRRRAAHPQSLEGAVRPRSPRQRIALVRDQFLPLHLITCLSVDAEVIMSLIEVVGMVMLDHPCLSGGLLIIIIIIKPGFCLP